MTIDKTISLSDLFKAALWVVLVVYAAGARSQEVKDLMVNNKTLTESVKTLTEKVEGLTVKVAELNTALKYIDKQK